MTATALIDARLQVPHLERTRDTLLGNLARRGEPTQGVLTGHHDGTRHPTGLLDVDAEALRSSDGPVTRIRDGMLSGHPPTGDWPAPSRVPGPTPWRSARRTRSPAAC
jgi:hypothetical protein